MPHVGGFAHFELHSRLATLLIAAVVLAGCGNTPAGGSQMTGTLPPPFVSTAILPTVQPTAQPSAQPTTTPSLQPTATVLIPGPLTTPDLSLRAGPVAVPLELRIPALQMSAPVVGVGITTENIMDAPRGPVNDPLWNTVFWYRGGSIPGESGTATLAGHVNDALGQPAIFSRISELVPGDSIIVYDTRSGYEVLFLVTETNVYSLLEAADPEVLRQVYGAGPVAGTGPQPAADGLSHLTLITCTGDFINGSFDHRLVVYAVQSQ